jgi:S-adenosylmethionine hydrolase
MPRAILTLTTDFGTSDHFVGVMKGVILAIQPQAQIVDITHDVSSFEIMEGAFVIGEAYRWFPKRTVHVVVVDPGVGTSRRPILIEAAGQYFVGPDNGVFSMVLEREKHKVRAITNEQYFHHPVSDTFHGRDIFAPVAAHLASGVTPAHFGKPVGDYHRGFASKPTRIGRRIWSGVVLKVDHFGNLITNYEAEEFAELRLRPFVMAIGTRQVARLVRTFGEAEPGEPVLVVGSSGYIEIAVKQGSAAKALGCGSGSPADLTIY